MAKEIRVSMDVILTIPEDWKVDGGRMVTPAGKAVGFLIAVEHDFEGPGLKILSTDKQMAKEGVAVVSYVQTEIEE